MSRSILIVAHLSPPSPLSAARRVAGLAKYLGRLGHRVTVLSSVASGSGAVEGAVRVLRTRDLMVSRVNWRRENFASLSAGGGYADAPSRVTAWLVPDAETVSWLPFAAPAAMRLARRDRIDCVITTSPPIASHLIGLTLAARGVPWIADFRDGWRFESSRLAFATGLHDRIDRALEAAVARHADVVTAVSDPIAEDLRRRLGARAVTVTNGFDPDDHVARAPSPAIAGLVSNDRHTLVHTGRMAYAGRSPLALLTALRESPDLDGLLEVLFAGPLSAEERALIDDPLLDGAARSVGSLPRETALELQRAADSLLLLTGGNRRGEMTQKIFEYLATRRPILVLGDDTEAARIVRAAKAGVVAPADDPVGIAAALREMVLGQPRTESAPEVERFAYPNLAVDVAEQVERAIGHRRR